MGLDMYLYKKTYLFSDDKDNISIVVNPTASEQFKDIVSKIDTTKIAYIIEEVGYWRKSNAIHKWFIDNCADGVDNCQNIDVSGEQLAELLEVVSKVLQNIKLVDGDVYNGSIYDVNGKEVKQYTKGKVIKDPSYAKENLPTQSGFFFGGTDYDEYYVKDLQETEKLLIELESKDDGEGEYTYKASW